MSRCLCETWATTVLFYLHEFRSGFYGSIIRRSVLWPSPVIKHRHLVHARYRAIRRASFFGKILALHIVARIGSQRNPRISALLRAVVHQPLFTNVEISRTCAAAPLVRQSLRNVVLKSIDPCEAALLPRLHLVVNPPLFFTQRLQLPAAIVNNPYR